jgi:hypothetical protein
MRLSGLGRDIAVILVVKLAVLGLLWWAFFSHPAATHMRVEPSRIEARLFAASPQDSPRADR